LTNVNGVLFFHADDGVHGDGLWRSDRTAAGTVMVKGNLDPGEFSYVGGTLFFTANGGLWKLVEPGGVGTAWHGVSTGDQLTLRLDDTGSSVSVQFFMNAPTDKAPTLTLPLGQMGPVRFDGFGGQGTLTIDLSHGNPLSSVPLGCSAHFWRIWHNARQSTTED
jgi:ELWxxDGT repeat protein